MKRLLLVVMMVLFIAGWSTAALAGWGTAARESEFFEHPTHYQSWDHMKFSLWGYKNMDQKDIEKSRTEGWWGKIVEVPKK
jgi:hypothetical protein